MRILHTADNHLGEAAYSRIDPTTGLNARGIDLLDSFKRVAGLAIEKKVGVLLIAGDFFTKVNPHPRYVLEVVRKLKQVSRHGIATIIVSGNHETPRLSTSLNPLALLGEIEGVHVALEPTNFNVDDYDFVCVPAPAAFDEIRNLFGPLLSIALKDSKTAKKILAAHIPVGQAMGSSEIMLESFIGECVDASQIPSAFQYVALGHMHKFQQIKQDNMPIFYSGSSEKHEFSEEHDDKFALIVDVEDGVEVSPVKLAVRKMLTIVDQDCSGLSAPKITRLVQEQIEKHKGTIADALVRIKLENIEVGQSRLIDGEGIKTRLNQERIFDLRLQPRTTVSLPESSSLGAEYILPPSKELELYVRGKKQYRGRMELLLKLGNEVIKEAAEALGTET